MPEFTAPVMYVNILSVRLTLICIDGALRQTRCSFKYDKKLVRRKSTEVKRIFEEYLIVRGQ